MTFDDLFDGSDSHRMRHVIPTNDLREHSMGVDCWCNPEVDDLVVIHNSMDERESYEQGRKPQ
jgi:hypothetical protein